MTALLIGKVLLLAFLLVAVGIVAFTYVRRRRAGVQPWTNPHAAPYLDLYRGQIPPAPMPPQLPEHARDSDSPDDSASPHPN